MKRCAALLVMATLMMAFAMPAGGETGTWGMSGTAQLAPVGPGPHRFFRLEQVTGTTLGARPGFFGTATISDLSTVALTCSTTQRAADGSWRLIAYGLGTDGAGYRIELSLDPDLTMTDLRVTKGAPDTCDVGAQADVWTGYQGAFFAGEGGGVHLDGGGMTAAGVRLEADLTIIPFTAQGLGTVVLTRGDTTEELRALCVQMSTPRPRVTWYQLLALSDDDVVYDIHIGDEDRASTTGDSIAVDVADPADVQGGCSAGSTTPPSRVVVGDFVTHDLL